MIKQYFNGNCIVTIDLKRGTKERFTEDDEFRVDFAESMDCMITEHCDGLCDFCYAGCTSKGKHADLLSDYAMKFINSLQPYTEIALNGNDLSHPQLEEFLNLLSDRSVIANLTVSQRHFMANIDLLYRWYMTGLIHGLGVSLSDSSDTKFISALKKFPTAILHVIAGIFTLEDIKNLQNNNMKLLVLGYKKKERGVNYYLKNWNTIELRIAILSNLITEMINSGRFDLISFDNLAIEQLKIKDMMSEKAWNEFYMGDDGQFTYYVDLVNNKFAKDSLSGTTFDIEERDAIEMFNFVRKVC